MSYFSKFKSILYNFSKNNRKIDYNINEVTDITTRIKIVNTFNKNSIFNYNVYKIQDGERPDTIAYKEYNDPKLHWIILLFNEIKNPLFEWPKNNFEMDSFIGEKYKGTSLFLNIHGIFKQNETPTDKFCRCEKNQFNLESYEIPIGSQIKLKKTSNIEYLGNVISFNTKNGELRVLFNNQDFSDDEIRTNPNNYQEIMMSVKNRRNNSTEEINIKNSCLTIINQTKNSLHHFEKNGNYIDFLVPYNEVLDDSYLESPSSVNKIFENEGGFYGGEFCFSNTILGEYFDCDDTTQINSDYLVTNISYEYTENEKKREIFLPRKDSLSSIIKNFNRLMREV